MGAEYLASLEKQPCCWIVEKAKEYNPKLIIMGSRGLGKVRRTILGSVSDYVLHHAHCTVAVYHASIESEQTTEGFGYNRLQWGHASFMAFRITLNLTICSTVRSGWQPGKHQSFALLVICKGNPLMARGFMIHLWFPHLYITPFYQSKLDHSALLKRL